MKTVACLTIITGVGCAVFFSSGRWSHWLAARSAQAPPAAEHHQDHSDDEVQVLKLSPQARKNLGLASKPVRLTEYWRSIQVPGVIVDRPGMSDRGVTSPAVGVVAEVHAFPGDMVRPGETLFTLRLYSDYLQNAQSELFKATRETELLKEQRARLESGAKSGAIPESRIIELDNQLRRQKAVIDVHRQDLLARGLAPDQLAQIMEGNFVSTISVAAPPPVGTAAQAAEPIPALTRTVSHQQQEEGAVYYEVQELKVDLGQQVQAGQLLSTLSNHQFLFLEGHAFKHDAPYLERAAQQRWPIRVEFAEDDSRHWPPLKHEFQIRHLANSIDPATRTFDFFVPLTNQSRAYETGEQTFVVWRFRPGQRVRMHVPVEHFRDVIVLPADAVVREGPEAYVFRQNGDLFRRFPVHVLYEDRLNMVVANDGSIGLGAFVAQNAAASLNRVLKAQAAGGAQPGIHVHADGTVHGAH